MIGLALLVAVSTYVLYFTAGHISQGLVSGATRKYSTSEAASCLIPDDEDLSNQAGLVDAVPINSIQEYIRSRLDDAYKHTNRSFFHDVYGINLGDYELNAYTRQLLSIHDKYFSDHLDKEQAWLPYIRSRLSLRPDATPLPQAPKQVITTDKSIDHLPPEFARWAEIMPDWKLKYFDDEGLRTWIDQELGGTKVQSIWNGLPRRVLQTDVFRYIAMLVEGGIYTDR